MISIVIPAYNEERALPHTLQQLLLQRGDYEVLVVDGGSNDRTCQVVDAFPRVGLLAAPKGRATQMNAGARATRGEWLLFLHADTQLPDGALLNIETLGSDPGCLAGGFRQRFTGQDWRLRLVSWLDNFRCDRTHIVYGDQAMFVRRGVFEQLGGFPQQAILEDVLFGEALLKVTTPRILDHYVTTDPRRFAKMGVWHGLYHCLAITARRELGLSVPDSHRFFEEVR